MRVTSLKALTKTLQTRSHFVHRTLRIVLVARVSPSHSLIAHTTWWPHLPHASLFLDCHLSTSTPFFRTPFITRFTPKFPLFHVDLVISSKIACSPSKVNVSRTSPPPAHFLSSSYQLFLDTHDINAHSCLEFLPNTH